MPSILPLMRGTGMRIKRVDGVVSVTAAEAAVLFFVNVTDS